jgi:hypothetical protein
MSEQQCAQCLNYNGQVVPWGEDFSGPAICRHCYEMDLRGDAETNRRVPGYYERNMALAEALHEGEADCGFDELSKEELEGYLEYCARYDRESAEALARGR